MECGGLVRRHERTLVLPNPQRACQSPYLPEHWALSATCALDDRGFRGVVSAELAELQTRREGSHKQQGCCRSAAMPCCRHMNTQSSYDRVADEYVERIFGELEHKPFDRRLLDRFAANVSDAGPACDVGCGPGHVARYLHARGVQISGIDLSAEMVARARRLTPAIEFQQADMMALPIADASLSGIVAFYSLIHIPRVDMVRALRELRRALQPGGLLLVSFHIGDETVHLDEWWGHAVSVDFFFLRSDEMVGYLTSAGFEIEEVIEREPYPAVEHQSRRSYIFARRAEE